MHVTLNLKSGNRKVGKIPVSTTEASSCPSSCPLASPEGAGVSKGADCYAASGPLGMHWRKIGEGGRGDQWDFFCKAVAKFPEGQLWRHNQAGDLPQAENPNGYNIDLIDAKKAFQLSDASKHTRGWTYTHYDMESSINRAVVQEMNDVDGLTVNLSADSLSEADKYYDLGIAPVCVTLPKNAPHRGNKTPNGLPIVVCPAQTQDDMSCQQCKLCQVRDRKSIVGFLAHGIASKRLSTKLEAK